MSPERVAAGAAAVEEQVDDCDLERVVREVGALKDDSDLEGWAPPQRGLQQQNSGPAGAAAAGVGAAGAVLPPLDEENRSAKSSSLVGPSWQRSMASVGGAHHRRVSASGASSGAAGRTAALSHSGTHGQTATAGARQRSRRWISVYAAPKHRLQVSSRAPGPPHLATL